MRVVSGSAEVSVRDRGCVLTIGNFDGLHRGHRVLLDTSVARSRELACSAVVYTFHPHPRRLLHPEVALQELMCPGQLEAGLEEIGADLLIREPFTREFSELSAEEFLRDVIKARVAPVEIFVGREFHFGKGRGGSGETLSSIAPRLGMGVHIVAQVCVDGVDVSSTRVRSLLAGGQVEEAARCLGAPYAVWGEVVHGDHRGRTLGFPTANLQPDNELLLAHGVYATRVRVFDGDRPSGPTFSAVTNVGTRPTFEPGRVLTEAHLLDYEGDLYGRRIAVEFFARVRDERAFAGPDELRAQIEADASRARALLRAGAA